MVVRVHEEIVRSLSIPDNLNGAQFSRACSSTMGLLIAWAIECDTLDLEAFRKGTLRFNASPKDGKVARNIPIMFKRPRWWVRTGQGGKFSPAIYADSNEDREIHAIIREVLEDKDWTRTAFVGDMKADFWSGIVKFHEFLPDDHPGIAEGYEGVFLIPWSTVKTGVNVEGHAVGAPRVQAVEEAITATLRGRCGDPKADPLPRLWAEVGLTR